MRNEYGTYKNVEYIGDGVYFGQDDIDRVWIFTSNGQETTNNICLEEDVLDDLITMLKRRNLIK